MMKRPLRNIGSLLQPPRSNIPSRAGKSTTPPLLGHFLRQYGVQSTSNLGQNISSLSKRSSGILISKRQHRFFSTDVISVWREKTDRLVDTPIGSFTPQLWNEAHMAILWWLDNDMKESVENSLQLLDRLYQEEQAASSADEAPPDFYKTDLLNLIINRWRKEMSEASSKTHKSELRPPELVKKLHQYHANSTYLKPDVQSYSMIIDASSSFPDNSEGVLLADSTLEWMVEQAMENPSLRPNVVTFSSVMNSWVKSGLPEAPQRVEDLLQRMKDLDEENPDWGVAPNGVTYSTAIDVWARVGRVDRVEELFNEIYVEYGKGKEDLKPTIHIFNGYLVALAKKGDNNRAEALLKQMEDLYEAGELDSKPTVISYSTVLDCFAKSKDRDAGERAEAILRQMAGNGVQPNTISYNSTINAYAKAGKVEHAESLLKEMYESYVQGNQVVQPTAQSYSIVLAAWSKSRSVDAGERGERILHLMKELAQSGELDRAPDIVSYNSVLDCWAKSSSREAPEKAQSFLKQMRDDGVDLDTYSYNIVLNILSRSGQPHKAEALMEGMQATGVSPDITTFNTLLAAWSRSRLKEAPERAANLFARMKVEETVKPDIVTFNTVLRCYSQIGNAESAEELLLEMIQNESGVKANKTSFNTAIAAWSRSRRPNAAERAELLLNKMRESGSSMKPDCISFNSVLSAWARSNDPSAAERCEAIFKVMQSQHQAGEKDIKPDIITYNTILHAWARSTRKDAPERAEAVHRDLQRRFNAGDQYMKPTGRCYASLISVWSKAKRPDASIRAEEYMNRILRLDERGQSESRPSTLLFTATIQAWGNSGDPDAMLHTDVLLQQLLAQFAKGNKYASPDSRLFGTILTVLASSEVPDKAERADKLIAMMKQYKVSPNSFMMNSLDKCYESRMLQNHI
jgi:pentatricopeptide repeat protein